MQLEKETLLVILNIVVSIPQAVGTVATLDKDEQDVLLASFNTASGRYCCNVLKINVS